MTLSVIVATYNRCAKLETLLQAISECSFDRAECEVLVVDNNSSDRTKEVVTKFQARNAPTFRYFMETRRGKSNALNTGIKSAKGEILAFTDDDCIPSRNWLDAILREFETDTLLAVLGGRVELYNKEDIAATLSLCDDRIQIARGIQVIKNPPIIGANMAFRRSFLDRIGEFDPLLGPGARCGIAEDVEILYRFHQGGFKIVYSPDVKVLHNHGRKNESDDFALSRQYAIGRGGLYCKHLLKADREIFGIAFDEIYGLTKTLVKGFMIRKEFPYHKIMLPGVLSGAISYLRATCLQRGMDV
jgi:glycosyltransferase involved in cell wall biosynthesis